MTLVQLGTTLHEQIFNKLRPLIGAEDCPENRAKVRALVKEALPAIADEDLAQACEGILG